MYKSIRKRLLIGALAALLVATAAPFAVLRKIRPGKKRLLLWRQQHRQRPPAAPRDRLADRHINLIHIRPFLPVHLDRHKMLIQKLRHFQILKRFPLHNVAPMACR